MLHIPNLRPPRYPDICVQYIAQWLPAVLCISVDCTRQTPSPKLIALTRPRVGIPIPPEARQRLTLAAKARKKANNSTHLQSQTNGSASDRRQSATLVRRSRLSSNPTDSAPTKKRKMPHVHISVRAFSFQLLSIAFLQTSIACRKIEGTGQYCKWCLRRCCRRSRCNREGCHNESRHRAFWCTFNITGGCLCGTRLCRGHYVRT